MNRLRISTENSEYQIIKSLKQSRVKRKKLREIFIEGIECIKQAMGSDIEITRIIINDKNNLSDWGKSIVKRYGNAKIIEMSDHLYNELSEKTDPAEMLVTARMPLLKIDEINADNPFIILFDRPGDYGNLGSLIRSANAFSVDGIFIMGHGIDIYEPKVIRASLGSIFFTKIIQIESMEKLSEYIGTQKAKSNMEIMGTDSTGTVSLENYRPKRPIMVIIGNEAKGMSVNLKAICDKIMQIPMEGNVNSLNVSCAASIIMWEVYKDQV